MRQKISEMDDEIGQVKTLEITLLPKLSSTLELTKRHGHEAGGDE